LGSKWLLLLIELLRNELLRSELLWSELLSEILCNPIVAIETPPASSTSLLGYSCRSDGVEPRSEFEREVASEGIHPRGRVGVSIRLFLV
jgi:hypothetical protein